MGQYLVQFTNVFICVPAVQLSVAAFPVNAGILFFSLLCDKNLFLRAAFVASENRASCSHKTLTWGWRKRLWEGHRLPLFGLQ